MKAAGILSRWLGGGTEPSDQHFGNSAALALQAQVSHQMPQLRTFV
jgi:hypothetical protein